MKVELYLNHGNELAAFAEFMAKVATFREANEKRDDQILDAAYVEIEDGVQPQTTPFVAAVDAPKKERKPRAKKEAVAEIPAVAQPAQQPVTQPEPTPAPAPEPATAPVPAPAAAPAAPSATKVALEDKVRALAKTNFVAVKALLATYNVERFGKLGEEHYPEFGPKLFALPEYPEPAAK